MYSNYNPSGPSAYGQNGYLDQQRNKPKRYSANKGYGGSGGPDNDSGFDSGIPSLDHGNDRNMNRSLFASHNNANSNANSNNSNNNNVSMLVMSHNNSNNNGGTAGGSSGRLDDKSSTEFRVPQIGRSLGVAGPISAAANTLSGFNSGNVGAGNSMQFGPGPANNSNSTNSNSGNPSGGSGSRASRRNRSASRQTGSRSRRSRQNDPNLGNTVSGAGGGNADYLNKSFASIDGPVLPQIGGGNSGGAAAHAPGSLLGNVGANGSAGGALSAGGPAGGVGGAAPAGRGRHHHGAAGVPMNHGPQSLTHHSEEHASAGVTTIKGLKPGNPNWTNQDNFFVVEQFDSRDAHVYCVLDGHGENGHLASRRCRENFPHHIKAASMDMRRAFAMMQNDLLSCEFDVGCSGATCALAVVAGGKLAVSNCGDSRAVLGRRNPNGTVTAHALTYDHKPEKPEERRRILSCGGHLGCRQVVVNQPGKGPVSVPVGPCRVWYQHMGETLGLAMSRSLGDAVVHRCGVSAEPETLEHTLDEYDEFMVLATDGVWDVMDNPQVVQMIANHAMKNPNWSPLEASHAVTRFARSRWEKLSPMIDDITCVVVRFKRS